MQKAQSIAEAFLNKIPIQAVENGEGMHKIKLQKLLFFAQEEFLYRYGKPLFAEKIEAWKHGPVVREVWNTYAEMPTHIIKSVPKETIFPLDVQTIIDSVWEKYGEKDTWYLRDLSHSYKIWRDKKDSGRQEITTDEILHYKQQCEKAKQEAKQYIQSLSDEFLQ